jgi:hypothetical protein
MPKLIQAAGITLLLAGAMLHAQSTSQPKHVDERCERFGTIAVANGAYIVQNNEWSSTARACIASDRSASFTVTTSEIGDRITGMAEGLPGSFASLYQGCHWGTCTAVNPFPIQVAVLKSEIANWNVTLAPGLWDQTFDLWFATKRSLPDAPDGAELMVILRAAPGQGYPGKRVGNVKIHGKRYDIWFASPPQTKVNYVAYVSTKPQTNVSNFDLRQFIRDAVLRGYIDAWWYQLDVEAGFEIWKGGAGLKTNAFSVAVK